MNALVFTPKMLGSFFETTMNFFPHHDYQLEAFVQLLCMKISRIIRCLTFPSFLWFLKKFVKQPVVCVEFASISEKKKVCSELLFVIIRVLYISFCDVQFFPRLTSTTTTQKVNNSRMPCQVMWVCLNFSTLYLVCAFYHKVCDACFCRAEYET